MRWREHERCSERECRRGQGRRGRARVRHPLSKEAIEIIRGPVQLASDRAAKRYVDGSATEAPPTNDTPESLAAAASA